MGLLAISKVFFMLLWPFIFLLIPFFRDKEKFFDKVKQIIKSD
jgi:hypothetical protein